MCRRVLTWLNSLHTCYNCFLIPHTLPILWTWWVLFTKTYSLGSAQMYWVGIFIEQWYESSLGGNADVHSLSCTDEIRSNDSHFRVFSLHQAHSSMLHTDHGNKRGTLAPGHVDNWGRFHHLMRRLIFRSHKFSFELRIVQSLVNLTGVSAALPSSCLSCVKALLWFTPLISWPRD